MISEDLQSIYATIIILGLVALIFGCVLIGFVFSKKPTSKFRIGIMVLTGIVSVILMSVVYLFPLTILSDLEFLHRCDPNGVIGVCRTGQSYQQIEAEVANVQIQLLLSSVILPTLAWVGLLQLFHVMRMQRKKHNLIKQSLQ